jgi:hypothetical protein
MFKKTITFEDLEGNKITEDFYFNLRKDEAIELQVSEKDGFAETVQKIIAEGDNAKLIAYFKQLILLTIGVKHEDGRQFIKSPEITAAFANTNAYSELFVELASDEQAAADFINGIFPKGFNSEPVEIITELPTAPPQLEGEKLDTPTEKSFEEYTRQELLEMPQDQFDALTGKDPSKMSQMQLVIGMQRKSHQQAAAQ